MAKGCKIPLELPRELKNDLLNIHKGEKISTIIESLTVKFLNEYEKDSNNTMIELIKTVDVRENDYISSAYITKGTRDRLTTVCENTGLKFNNIIKRLIVKEIKLQEGKTHEH